MRFYIDKKIFQELQNYSNISASNVEQTKKMFLDFMKKGGEKKFQKKK